MLLFDCANLSSISVDAKLEGIVLSVVPIALFVGRRTPPPAFALIAVSGPRLIVDPARLISSA